MGSGYFPLRISIMAATFSCIWDTPFSFFISISHFWEKEKSNVKDIGKALLLDSSTLTPLLKKLEKKGYITRVRSNIDERKLEVEITDKGKKLKTQAKLVPEKMGKCIDLTEEEAIALYSLINKVLINVERND